MSKDKRSFFEKLTGTMRMEEEEATPIKKIKGEEAGSWLDEESEKDAELSVDVYQTSDMIIVKSMIAGVRPEDLDVSITRDMVTIKGTREEEKVSKEDDYYARELYWGSFSRSIILPAEVDVEGADAIEKHGLLVIRLPKVDKNRQTRLRVKG